MTQDFNPHEDTGGHVGEELFEKPNEHLQRRLVEHDDFPKSLTSDLRVLGQYGSGIQLYFEFTYKFAYVALAVASLYLPLLFFSWRGNTMCNLDVSTAGFQLQSTFAKLSIANVGWRFSFLCPSSQCDKEVKPSRLCYCQVKQGCELAGDNTTVCRNSLGQVCGYAEGEYNSYTFMSETVSAFSQDDEVDKRTITLLAGVLDACGSLIILIFAWWFEFVRIPRVVQTHETEMVTPDQYSVRIEGLPKRYHGAGGHRDYANELRSHFDYLFAATVHRKNVVKGMPVVDAKDEGKENYVAQHVFRMSCCPKRHDGFDYKGRHLGHVFKVTPTSCYVRWDSTDASGISGGWAHSQDQMRHFKKEDLLDAKLLWRMEHAGMERVPLGSKSVVYDVCLCRDFNEKLGQMRECAEREKRIRQRKWLEEKKTNHKSLMFAKSSTGLSVDGENLNMDLNMHERDVVGGFVIFARMQYRKFILREYRFTRTILNRFFKARRLFFADHAITVTEATTPENIFWENADYPPRKRRERSFMVFLSCVGIVLILALVVGWARLRAEKAEDNAFRVWKGRKIECGGDSSQDQEHEFCECIRLGVDRTSSAVYADTPAGIRERCSTWLDEIRQAQLWGPIAIAVSALAIIFGGVVVGALVPFGRPITIMRTNIAVVNATAIVYILALGVIRVLIHADFGLSGAGAVPGTYRVFGAGRYKGLSPEWYQNVGGSIAVTLFANTFYPVVGTLQGPLFYAKVYLLRGWMKLMPELLALYTPPHFPFASRHAEQIASLFAMLTFCGGMPILAILLPLNFFIFYWCDKCIFFYASHKPPRFTHHLMLRQVQILQLCVLSHCVFNLFVYDNEKSAPSFPSLLARALGVSDRLSRASAVPSALVALLILASLFLRFASFATGSNPITHYFYQQTQTKVKQLLESKATKQAKQERRDIKELMTVSTLEEWRNRKQTKEECMQLQRIGETYWESNVIIRDRQGRDITNDIAQLHSQNIGRDPAPDMDLFPLRYILQDNIFSKAETDNFEAEVGAMKRKGQITSYHVHEIPGYEFLNPPVEVTEDTVAMQDLLGVGLTQKPTTAPTGGSAAGGSMPAAGGITPAAGGSTPAAGDSTPAASNGITRKVNLQVQIGNGVNETRVNISKDDARARLLDDAKPQAVGKRGKPRSMPKKKAVTCMPEGADLRSAGRPQGDSPISAPRHEALDRFLRMQTAAATEGADLRSPRNPREIGERPSLTKKYNWPAAQTDDTEYRDSHVENLEITRQRLGITMKSSPTGVKGKGKGQGKRKLRKSKSVPAPRQLLIDNEAEMF